MAQWSPYNYTYNNPIRYIDIDGLAPGDPFTSMIAAAKDFSSIYGKHAIQENREFSATIYSYRDDNGNQVFTYNVPKRGTKSGSSSRRLKKSEGTAKAGVHSHAAYSDAYDNNEFSDTDIEYSEDHDMPEYVTTPDGSLQVYDSIINKDIPVSFDSPSDPKDPNIQNTNYAMKPNRTAKERRVDRRENRRERRKMKREYNNKVNARTNE